MIVFRLFFAVVVLYFVAVGYRWAIVVVLALTMLAMEALTLIIVGLTDRVARLERAIKTPEDV